MIRALVFDFDGLILDTESALIRAYADVHAAHGVAFDEALFLRSVGHADYAFDPWRNFARGIAREELEAERVQRNRRREGELLLLAGVAELLAAGQAAGLTLALASNSSHAHCERHLRRLGLLEQFAFLACREDVAAPKPEPDLYRHVLQQFGLRGHEAIAFEDSATGSIAAKRAGLWTVVAPNSVTARHDFRHADLRVNSLADVTLPGLRARFESPAPRGRDSK